MAEVKLRPSVGFPELAFIESSDIAGNASISRLSRAIAWGSSAIALVMAFVSVLNTLLSDL